MKYLKIYTNMLMCFYTIVPMPFGASQGQKAFPFLPWLPFFVKEFQLHCKDANILNLKLGNTSRPSYFPTSTPSRHPPWPQPTHYKRSIIKMESFWHLICTNLMSFKFSLIFNTFVHFQISGVFINKVMQGSNKLVHEMKLIV